MRSPSVSVLMPARIADSQQERWLYEAVASIRGQTFKDYQMVIVNDGSPYPVDWNYYGHHAEVITLPECKGIANALNVGLDRCRSNLVVHMDADDIAYPLLIRSHIDFFTFHPRAAVNGIQLRAFHYETGEETTIGGGFPTRHPPVVNLETALEHGRKGNFWWVNHPGVCFRKDAVLSVGGYREADLNGKPVPGMEDMILWHTLVRAGMTVYNCQEVLMDYRWKPSPGRKTHEYFEAHKRETEKLMNHDLYKPHH